MRTLTLKWLILGVLVVAILNLGIGLFVGYHQGKQEPQDSAKPEQHLWNTAEADFLEVTVPFDETKPHRPHNGWGEGDGNLVFLYDVEYRDADGQDYRDEHGLYWKVIFALGTSGDWYPIKELRSFRWHLGSEPEVVDLWGRKFQIIYVLNIQDLHPIDGGRNNYVVILRRIP